MSRGMLVWESTLAGLQVIVGASAALTDLIGLRWAGAIVVVVAALQFATATYKRGLASPDGGGSQGGVTARYRRKDL